MIPTAVRNAQLMVQQKPDLIFESNAIEGIGDSIGSIRHHVLRVGSRRPALSSGRRGGPGATSRYLIGLWLRMNLGLVEAPFLWSMEPTSATSNRRHGRRYPPKFREWAVRNVPGSNRRER
jgi:hypothetical protein